MKKAELLKVADLAKAVNWSIGTDKDTLGECKTRLLMLDKDIYVDRVIDELTYACQILDRAIGSINYALDLIEENRTDEG